jgi:hypothetical protein
MKTIKNEKTTITEDKVKFKGSESKELDYKDLIEIALDAPPQGGFSLKDIRDRNRIQDALDKSTNAIALEDNDYDNLEKLLKDARWPTRHRELDAFLSKFEDGDYKKEVKKD